MNAIVVTWRELLVVLVIVLAVYALEMWVLLRGVRRRSVAATEVAPSPAATPVPTASAEPFAALALRGEVDALRGEVAQLRAQLDALTSPSVPPAALSPYAQAIHLARDGRAAAELAETCGISRSEAELIVALHQRGPGS